MAPNSASKSTEIDDHTTRQVGVLALARAEQTACILVMQTANGFWPGLDRPADADIAAADVGFFGYLPACLHATLSDFLNQYMEYSAMPKSNVSSFLLR